jgi:hypothetical protein
MILLTLLIFRFVETSYTPVKELETRQNKSDPVCQLVLDRCGNDPSAGSPTETLLRLHLPLNDKV